VNASVQYEARVMPEVEVKVMEKNEDYIDFLKDVIPRLVI